MGKRNIKARKAISERLKILKDIKSDRNMKSSKWLKLKRLISNE